MLTIGIHGVTPAPGADPTCCHDHGVAALRQGRVVYCQELERHTGRKHDGALGSSIEHLVAPLLRDGSEIRVALVNSVFGSRFCSANKLVDIEGSPDLEVPSMLAECRGRLAVAGEVRPARFFTVCHEIAHLGTCLPFFGSFRAGSLLVHIDGGASRSCASAWHFDGERITCLDHGWHAGPKGAVNNFNDSLLSCWILGLSPAEHLSMPGKLMGLASLGAPDRAAHTWLQQREWLRHPASERAVVRDEIRRGLPHLPFADLSDRNPGCHVLAATMQRHLEDEVLAYVQRWREATGARTLYYSGGAALNVHANTRLEREGGFDAVFIPPAPSDAGLALGAAAFLEWRAGEVVLEHPPFLNDIPPRAAEETPRTDFPIVRAVEDAARAITRGEVVGVWTGKAEIGPRALGHRSLLARPDSVELRRRLSEQMKGREWYRPVAPMLLAEVAQDALIGHRSSSVLSRFMLGAWRLAPNWAGPFAGCVHADGTVRAQVVERGATGLGHIRHLLVELREVHGIQGVINTSFNERGKPIAHRLDHAVDAGTRMGIDCLWLPENDSEDH